MWSVGNTSRTHSKKKNRHIGLRVYIIKCTHNLALVLVRDQTNLHPRQHNDILLPILRSSNHYWHDIATHGYSIPPQHERNLDVAFYTLVVYLVPSPHSERHRMARPNGQHCTNLVRYMWVLMVRYAERIILSPIIQPVDLRSAQCSVL